MYFGLIFVPSFRELGDGEGGDTEQFSFVCGVTDRRENEDMILFGGV